MASSVHAEASNDAQPVARAAFDDLVRVETRLYNALNERLRDRCGIAASQFELLDRVARQPGARVADLAGAFAVGIGATSKGVDRLTAAGWVRREPNPADGRSSLLRLTDDGLALVERSRVEFDRLLAEQLIDGLDPEDLASLGRVLRLLRDRLEARRVGLPAG